MTDEEACPSIVSLNGEPAPSRHQESPDQVERDDSSGGVSTPSSVLTDDEPSALTVTLQKDMDNAELEDSTCADSHAKHRRAKTCKHSKFDFSVRSCPSPRTTTQAFQKHCSMRGVQ